MCSGHLTLSGSFWCRCLMCSVKFDVLVNFFLHIRHSFSCKQLWKEATINSLYDLSKWCQENQLSRFFENRTNTNENASTGSGMKEPSRDYDTYGSNSAARFFIFKDKFFQLLLSHYGWVYLENFLAQSRQNTEQNEFRFTWVYIKLYWQSWYRYGATLKMFGIGISDTRLPVVNKAWWWKYQFELI